MALKEEKEEVGRRGDRKANKKEPMDHSCLISSPLPLGRVLDNLKWVVYIFYWDGSSDLVLVGLTSPSTQEFECSELIASI